MSRYPIPAHGARYQVIVGWDDPLETFWAQVFDPTIDDDDTAYMLWEGLGYQAITTVEALAAAIESFATLPAAVVQQLHDDRTHAAPRTPLQERMLRLGTLIQRR